jgi:hypothetical protein
MFLFIFASIILQIHAQQQYFPPQSINGTFGLQLNSAVFFFLIFKKQIY